MDSMQVFNRLTPLAGLLTGERWESLILQWVVLFVGELRFLFYFRRHRAGEIVVLSRSRLWLAVLAMSVTSLAYYQLCLHLRSRAGWVATVLYYPAAVLGTIPLTILQQTIVELVNWIGGQPFVKDLVRPHFAGNDFNHAIVRRCALYVFWWFLLLPGLLLSSPLPDALKLGIMGLWCLLVLWGMAITQY